MEVPILKQGNILIASVQEALSDKDLLNLQNRLSVQVGSHRIRGVIIDVTVLDVMDSFAVRVLRNLAEVIKLRGARTVIVGIQPEVAMAMVRLGLTLQGIPTALDLDDGLAMLLRAEKDPGLLLWKQRQSPATRAS